MLIAPHLPQQPKHALLNNGHFIQRHYSFFSGIANTGKIRLDSYIYVPKCLFHLRHANYLHF